MLGFGPARQGRSSNWVYSSTEVPVIRKSLLISALSVSSIAFGITEADILNAEAQFAENMKNVEFVKTQLEAAGVDTSAVSGGNSNPVPFDPNAPWYSEREAWNDLVVALMTLQTVSNNVQAAIPSLVFALFNFPVFTVRHTALCTQLTQLNTAWTSLEFADMVNLPPQHKLGSQFYIGARAVVNVTRGPAGLQCPL